jgi:type VI secretion system protein ImpL
VFEGAGGKPLEDIKVPGFFTYAGFQRAFVDRLGDITEQVKRDRWVLGSAGEQTAVSEQYDNLVDDLLNIYTRDFENAWRQALSELRLKRLTADKPKYIALSAVSAATSPIKQLLESIRDETALTRERPELKKDAKDDKGGKPAALPPGLMKQQDRAPGAAIEASFKHFHVMVEGDGGKKPVDQLVATLGEINQSLTLAATNPGSTAQANASLQNQVANLRASAARFPPPFNDMVRGAANEFIGDVSKATADQIMLALRDQVTPACTQVVNGRYPFVRGSQREVPLADFGRMFGPGGVLDKFFQQYLAPITDTSSREWTFRPDSPVGVNLNRNMLRSFQRAAEIRDTFFATGGIQPSIQMSVIPPSVTPPAPQQQQTGFSFGPAPPPQPTMSVKMEVNGTLVESKPGRNSPVAVSWPGAGGRTAILVEEVAGGFGQSQRPPSVLEKQGAWSLFRMLDSAGAVKRGDRVFANFVVGGRELTYQISVGSVHNPFNLPAIREFRCPSGA